jgi:membrane protease YdiL (CAAX protease family)
MFKNAEGKVRSGWKIAAALGSFFVILTVVEMIVAMVLMFTVVGSAESISSLYNELFEKMMEWSWLLSILQTIIMIAVAVFTWKVIFKRKLFGMGLPSIGRHAKELAWGLLFGAVSMTLIFALLLATGLIKVESFIPKASADTFLYLLIFILVGFAEEIFSRGYCMSVMRQTRSVTLILLVPAVIFSLMHISNPGFSFSAFINIAIAGLLFAYMYMKSGNIWMPIGFHITWNYFQGCVFGLSTSGLGIQGLIKSEYTRYSLLGGGAFGPEEGIFTTAVLLLGFLFVKWYYRKSTLDFLMMDQNDTQIAKDGMQSKED